MENSTEELQEGGGVKTEINEEEAEQTEEKTHNNLKGSYKTHFNQRTKNKYTS